MTYGTDTVKSVSVDMSSSGQGAERVVVPSDGDVDSQFGAFEVPHAGSFHVSSTLEVLVQLLGDGVWDLVPRRGRVDIGGDLAVRNAGDTRFEGRRSTSP